MVEQLKLVSIRGRMAYGIACLKQVLKQTNNNQPILHLLLDRLTEFVEKDRLDLWEQRIGEVVPYAILDTHPDNIFENYKTISVEEVLKLKTLYESMPNAITDLIDDVVNIGESNLYGGVDQYSQNTLDAILAVLEKMKNLALNPPDIMPYLSSPFSENGGWGYTKNMTGFM